MAVPSTSTNSMLAICSVTQPHYVTSAAGVTTSDGTTTYYFQSASMYSVSRVATATGVNYINPDTWQGKEPLVKVAQLILSGKLERLYAEVENPVAGKPNKLIPFFVTPDKVVSVKTETTGILNITLTTNRGGVSRPLGKVFGVRSKTSNRYN